MKNQSIHTSSIKNRLKDIKKYLNQGIDVDSLGEYGCTPLHYACREGNIEIVEFLIKNGADVNIKNRYSTLYPLFEALCLLNKRKTFLIIKLLIDNGADINSVDSFGNTLLHHAVEQENIDLIELLIALGCNINRTLRYDKDTVLHYAYFQKNLNIISKLIESGANQNIFNIYNKIPKSYL